MTCCWSRSPCPMLAPSNDCCPKSPGRGKTAAFCDLLIAIWSFLIFSANRCMSVIRFLGVGLLIGKTYSGAGMLACNWSFKPSLLPIKLLPRLILDWCACRCSTGGMIPIKSGPVSLTLFIAILVPALSSGRKKNPATQNIAKVKMVKYKMYRSLILRTDLNGGGDDDDVLIG